MGHHLDIEELRRRPGVESIRAVAAAGQANPAPKKIVKRH